MGQDQLNVNILRLSQDTTEADRGVQNRDFISGNQGEFSESHRTEKNVLAISAEFSYLVQDERHGQAATGHSLAGSSHRSSDPEGRSGAATAF
jgi:hypothetical protein